MTHLMMMVCGFVKLMSLLHPCCSNMRPSSDAGVAYTQGVFCFSRGVVVVCLNNYSPSAPTGQTSAPIGPMQLPAATFGGKTLTNILDPTVRTAIHSRGALLFIHFLLCIIVYVCVVCMRVLPPATHPSPALAWNLACINFARPDECLLQITPDTDLCWPPSHPPPPQAPHTAAVLLPYLCLFYTRPQTCPACILHTRDILHVSSTHLPRLHPAQDILHVSANGTANYNNPGSNRWPQIYVLQYTVPLPPFQATTFFQVNVGFLHLFAAIPSEPA